MADEQTLLFLEDWGFPELVSIFKEHNIKIDQFKNLRPSLIGELIPDIYKCLEFMKKWKDEFGSCATLQGNNNAIIESTVENSGDREDISNNQQKRSRSNESGYRKRIKRQEFSYLKDLLKRHNFGNALKAEYSANKALTDQSSIFLCDIIASDLITDVHSCLSHQDFADLTDEIISIFPNEQRDTYYIPPVYKKFSKDDKSEHSRGRLVDKFHNKLQQYRRMCNFKKTVPPLNTEAEDALVLTPEIQRSLNLLEHINNFEEILPHWKSTILARSQIFKKQSGGKVDIILKKYPILVDPQYGYQLVDIDFNGLYKSDAVNIYGNWESVFTKLWNKKGNKKCSKSMQTLQDTLLQEETTQHAKEFIQLLLLPHLIPPRCAMKTKTRSCWKPSIEESKDGFIIYLKNAADINEKHQERVSLMYERGLTVQPYIVGVGETLGNVSNFYIIVEKVRYRFESALKALDICMKLFFVWDIEYPPESQQVWIFLQYALYKFRTERDTSKAHVLKILDNIGIPVPS